MKTTKLTSLIYLTFLLASSYTAQAQWTDAGTYVRLNTSADDVHIGSATNPGAKLRVVDDNTIGETVDFTTTGNLTATSDLLNLAIGSGSSDNAEIIEALRGSSPVYHLYGNGKIDIRKGSTTGRAIEVNGEEALWSNIDYFSWGFGKDYNYFGPEVLIGDGSIVPFESDGLTLTGSEDLRFEGTLGKYNRYTESGTLKAIIGHSGTDIIIRNFESGGDVVFGADGSIDMVIETGGEVGIGTISPEVKFHISDGDGTASAPNFTFDMIVEDDDYAYISLDAANYSGIWMANGADRFYSGIAQSVGGNRLGIFNGDLTERISITSTGNVGIGTTSPAFKLQVAGNVDVTGELTAASDMRLKRNIEPLENALDVVQKLNPVSYNFKTDEYPEMELAERHKMGLIAQEVEAILPALVSEGSEATDENGDSFNVKSVNYVEMIPLLIKSIQELQDENEALKQRLEKLEKK